MFKETIYLSRDAFDYYNSLSMSDQLLIYNSTKTDDEFLMVLNFHAFNISPNKGGNL